MSADDVVTPTRLPNLPALRVAPALLEERFAAGCDTRRLTIDPE